MHPVNLERWLMEGSYSKVWNAREEAPTPEYKFFVDSLMGTIRLAPLIFCSFSDFQWHGLLTCHHFSRNEIASCEETAYDSLPVSEAAQLLFFKSSNELIKFAQSVSSPLPP